MSTNKSFSESEANDAKTWDLPFVEDATARKKDATTNALNRRSDWKYEPPEEVEEISPPTADEIEAIRQAAFDEGHSEGKATGYEERKAQGLEEVRTLDVKCYTASHRIAPIMAKVAPGTRPDNQI